MGAKIGKDSEISTNLAGRYDLIEIGDRCFIADEVVLGDEDIRRGWMRLEKLKTGSRVFIGNDAVVPPGSIIPTGALIGIKSKPPAESTNSPRGTRGLVRRRSSCPCGKSSKRPATGPTRRHAGRSSCAPVSRPCTFLCRTCCSSPSEHGPSSCSDQSVLEGKVRPSSLVQFLPRLVAISIVMALDCHRREMDDDGPLRAAGETDVVVLGDANGSGRRALLGTGRPRPARPSSRHALPALDAAVCSARSSAKVSIPT